ncbi:hypothetical protein OJF2_14620 [Aquisphaera giovannonii]|uniref:Uncharacterized protein n=1 Tax=Aquisphaera giovannonii TaxID=406548 RepID=A0A5B9VZ71_9BACT|nr:hypothetical protein [Aquisphaera giovannonii]QEH32970.1 hypothetical protein OJF2_14620 [Aquisphaera giovannonii]
MEPGRAGSEARESLTLELKSLRWPSPGSETMDQPSCPECASLLDLNQPDEESPGEFLAICSSCRLWYLLGGPSEEGEMLLLELPSLAAVLKMARGSEQGGSGRRVPGRARNPRAR